MKLFLLRWLPVLISSILVLSPSLGKTSTGKWELISNKDGFITKRKKVPNSNIFAFRGETVTDVPIGKIISVFVDSNTRKNWINMYGGDMDLKVRNELDKTYWIRFNTPWPTSDRDYVLRSVGSVDSKNKTYTCNIQSVDHPSKGEQKCCVRGMAYGTYYRFQVLPGTNKTKVEVEVHTDPKGWIPSWLTNIIQKKWPKRTLSSLLREASKNGVKVHDTFKSW